MNNSISLRNAKELSYIKKKINDDEWPNFVIEFTKKVEDVGLRNIDIYETYLIWLKKRLRIKKLNTLHSLI